MYLSIVYENHLRCGSAGRSTYLLQTLRYSFLLDTTKIFLQTGYKLRRRRSKTGSIKAFILIKVGRAPCRRCFHTSIWVSVVIRRYVNALRNVFNSWNTCGTRFSCRELMVHAPGELTSRYYDARSIRCENTISILWSSEIEHASFYDGP